MVINAEAGQFLIELSMLGVKHDKIPPRDASLPYRVFSLMPQSCKDLICFSHEQRAVIASLTAEYKTESRCSHLFSIKAKGRRKYYCLHFT